MIIFNYANKALFVLGMMFLTLSASVQADTAAVVPVSVAQVESQAFSKPIAISGLLQNKSQKNLSFKVGGLVKQVNVDEGQEVKLGQILASLDLKEVKAQFLKAKSVLQNAKQELARYTSLQGQDALSLQQLQAAENKVAVAKSNMDIAEFNYTHSIIRAPQDGRILKRFKEPNELINAGQPVLIFAESQRGWVLRAGVTDKDILRLTMGDLARVKFDAFPGKEFEAQLSEKAVAADVRTQTFEIELSINAQDASLLTGLVGHAEIQPSRQQQVYMIPMTALVSADTYSAQVYVLTADKKVKLRTLPIAFIHAGELAVSEGLPAGEQLIVNGASYLSEQSQVSIQ